MDGTPRAPRRSQESVRHRFSRRPRSRIPVAGIPETTPGGPGTRFVRELVAARPLGRLPPEFLFVPATAGEGSGPEYKGRPGLPPGFRSRGVGRGGERKGCEFPRAPPGRRRLQVNASAPAPAGRFPPCLWQRRTGGWSESSGARTPRSGRCCTGKGRCTCPAPRAR